MEEVFFFVCTWNAKSVDGYILFLLDVGNCIELPVLS